MGAQQEEISGALRREMDAWRCGCGASFRTRRRLLVHGRRPSRRIRYRRLWRPLEDKSQPPKEADEDQDHQRRHDDQRDGMASGLPRRVRVVRGQRCISRIPAAALPGQPPRMPVVPPGAPIDRAGAAA